MTRTLRKQTQAFLHRPDEGTFGDCDRTAWAVLLGMPRDEMPNWATVRPDVDTQADFDARRRAVLASLGVKPVNIVFNGDIPLNDVLTTMEAINPGIPFILGGTSRNGTGHSVVAVGGEIFCDPSIDQSGIVGPLSDGMWWITYAGLEDIAALDTDEALAA